MIDDIKERNDDPDPEKQVPPGREAYTMTALLVDRKVYLSSPIKGGGYVYRGKTLSKQTPLAQVVQAALLRCRSQYSRELIHKNEGTCGEVMTSQMFCIDQPNEPLNDKGGKFQDVPQCGRIVCVLGSSRFVELAAWLFFFNVIGH